MDSNESASTFSFEPRWKEELLCRTPWAHFTVELTMGELHVYFPDEAKWKKAVPAKLHRHWAGIADQLKLWCAQQSIPLSICSDAWVELHDAPLA